MVKTELIDFQYILDCTLKNKVTDDVSNIFIVANFSSLMAIMLYIYTYITKATFLTTNIYSV